ncbi:MAG TPA: DUF6726 family protein [Paraburkholderia sp.]|jgi:hypothetical protein|nr:DUF6726 family protein [Paraburkholderia sp.]
MTTSPSREATQRTRLRRLRSQSSWCSSSLAVRAVSALTFACLTLPLDGCAAAAFPCRVASATLKILPVVGHPAAVPFDACADALD